MMRNVALAMITTAILGIGEAQADRVQTSAVTVDGSLITGSDGGGAKVYRGIPFAAAPIGDNRWRAPQPVTPWHGIRPATAFGPDCAQKPVPGDAAPLGVPSSEDCLYLNVWAPVAAAKAPVIVWLYGGGFVNGGSSPDVYSGASFARDGVIMVSFNYRLGRFGFFAHPALGSGSPNFALMDQIAALKWVKRNIAAFGGDPDNVTIFGQSAGGESVHLLLGSPAAKGLFARAIVESGFGGDGVRNPILPVKTMADAAKAGSAFATANGISGGDARSAALLRALPADRLVGDLNMTTMVTSPDYAGPVVDGTLVPDTPWNSYLKGISAAVPVIIGANSAEGMTTGKTKQEIFAALGPVADIAKSLYDPQGTADAGAIETAMMGDRLMLESTRTIAASLSGRQPVWQYRFDYVASNMVGEWKFGAPHATEIPYVMDTVAARYGAKLTAADARVAKTMHGYWVNFAKRGDPNAAGLPSWPLYDARLDNVLIARKDGAVSAGVDPARARLDAVHALLPE
jgi:para-nitrobenzyl esterase